MGSADRNDPILVTDYRQLTSDWAQSVLQLHDPGATVQSVALVNLHIGTTTRIRLVVEHTSTAIARHWFVKLPSRDWKARIITALPRLLQTEVRFYQHLAAQVPMQIPTCLAARSSWGRGAILVLADLTEQGGSVGTASDTLDLPQAQEAVVQLARFHACFRHDTAIQDRYPWLADSVRRLEDLLGSILAVPLMKRGLKKAGNLIPPELHEPALRYAKNRKKAMVFLGAAPQTLTHHDCHPGNLFRQADGSIGFLDWQLVRLGDGIGDLAYLLATTLSPEDRQSHETDLLAQYADTAGLRGKISPEELMTRYRAHCCYAFEAMVVTLAIGDMMELSSNHELIRRTAAVVQELDCFSSLPV